MAFLIDKAEQRVLEGENETASTHQVPRKYTTGPIKAVRYIDH